MTPSNRLMIAAVALLPALWACSAKPPKDPVVPIPASVKFFTATPGQVAQPGEKVTLSWETENATSVAITTLDGKPVDVGGTPAPTGTAQVEVEGTTVFLISAHGEGGNDRSSTSVLVPEKPDEMLFTAFPQDVRAGEPVSLVWNAPFASEVQIIEAGGAQVYSGPAQGSLVLKPLFTTSYTLTAGDRTMEVPVKVSPVIAAFGATPESAQPGETVTLHWSVGGATSVSLVSTGRGELTRVTSPGEMTDGSFVDTVPANIASNGVLRYTLEARTPTQLLRQDLELWVGTNPKISQFSTPNYAKENGQYQVAWKILNADSLELVVDGEVIYEAQSSAEVAQSGLVIPAPPPGLVQQVELRARNGRGGFTNSDKHIVTAVGVPIFLDFSISPQPPTVNGGEPVTLTWNVTNARSVRIKEKATGRVLTQVLGMAAESGSVRQYPNKPTVYVLEADNTAGDSVLPAPEVSVGIGTPAKLTFSREMIPAGSSIFLTGTTATGGGDIRVANIVPKNVAGDQFIDILSTGTPLNVVTGDDTTAYLITLPEPFNTSWAGMAVGGQTVSVAINGWLVFSPTTIGGPVVPPPTLPTNTFEPKSLLVFAEDLQAAATTKVLWQLDTVAGQKRLIVQWNDVQFYATPAKRATFQAQIYENGEVVVAFPSLTSVGSGDTPLVGVINENETAAYAPNVAQLDPNKIPVVGDTFHFFGLTPIPAPITASTQTISASVDMGDGQLLVEGSPNLLNAGEVYISELNYNPVAGKSEWIELTSTTQRPVDLNGWTLDFGGGSTHTIIGSLIVPPNGRIVLGPDADAAEQSAGGAPIAYIYATGLSMPDASGSLKLSYGGMAYSTVPWTAAGTAGVALQNDRPRGGTFSVASGGQTTTTCPATASYGASGQKGTPGGPGTSICHPFRWAASSIPGAFQSISATGRAITGLVSTGSNSIDYVNVALDMTAFSGHPINIDGVLYGNTATPLRVDSNGFVELAGTVSSNSNPTVASTSTPNGTIAPFWDDLAGGPSVPSSAVYWQQFDPDGTPASGDEYTLISWEGWKQYYVTPSNINFQVKFYETTGDIEFHYGVIDISGSTYDNGRSATAEVESLDGKYMLAASINAPNIVTNSGYRFTKLTP